MLHKTRGIVFRNTKFKETSIITRIYTEKYGWQSYLVNGVRSARAKQKMSLFQPLTILDLVVYQNEKKDIQRISEQQFAHIYQTLPFDVIKSSLGIFLLEIFMKSVKESDTNPRLFQYISSQLIALDAQTAKLGTFHIHFMIDLAQYLGFKPGDLFSEDAPYFNLQEGTFMPVREKYCLTREESQVLSGFLNRSMNTVSKSQKKQLVQNLIQYYQFHIEGFHKVNSPQILEIILNT